MKDKRGIYFLIDNQKKGEDNTNEFKLVRENLNKGVSYLTRWSLATNFKNIQVGDIVYLYHIDHKKNKKGIIARGVVKCLPFIAKHWKSDKKLNGDLSWYIKFAYDSFIGCDDEFLFENNILSIIPKDKLDYLKRQSGTKVPEEYMDELEYLWDKQIKKTQIITGINDDFSLEEKDEVLEDMEKSSNFQININNQEIDNSGKKHEGRYRKCYTTQINFNELNKEKKRLGTLGEMIVYNMEKSFLLDNQKSDLAKKVKHISLEEGDGFGYDILSFELDGSPKYIEVKTTKANSIDNFYISRNEIEVSKSLEDQYYIYRLYNLNVAQLKVDLKIMRGKVNQSSYYDLEPISFKVKFK